MQQKLVLIFLGILLDRMIISNRWLYLIGGFVLGFLVNEHILNFLLTLVK